MSYGLADILLAIVIFQLFFTSLFLFTNRGGRRSSNELLGVFFLVIGLNLLDNFLLREGVYSGRAAFAFWSVWLLLLFGPLLYLYTQSVLYRDFHLNWRKVWHFVPFAVLFLITEIYWLALGSGERMKMLGEILLRQGPDDRYWDSALIFLQ